MDHSSETLTPDLLQQFDAALASLPEGYIQGHFRGRPWGLTLKRSSDGRRIWLFGEELGGTEIVSFNYYRIATAKPLLKPCEMSSSKVIDFVLGFTVRPLEA